MPRRQPAPYQTEENNLSAPRTTCNEEFSKKPPVQSMLVQLTTDGVPKLYCPICNKALVSLSGYVKHLKKHEPPGGFICRYCDSKFCYDEELKRHLDAVHTTIACRICKSNTFSLESDYREHIRLVHNGIDRELFVCSKCGAEYKTLDPYRRHMDTQCGTVKPFKCDQCSMSFVTKYNLKQHKESHNGERKYCCSYCGKNFLQKGRLVEHERSHTGEKPYKCDVCGKCFAHRESIVTHSSIHTGIRLVECRCCQSRFSCYSNLIKHRRTRPDTCGLPEYDPPKNRVRTHRSRIPATLNPTSEIKVGNINKVIKPDDLEKDKQLKKTNRPIGGNLKISKRKLGKNIANKGGNTKEKNIQPQDCVSSNKKDELDSDEEPLAKIRQHHKNSFAENLKEEPVFLNWNHCKTFEKSNLNAEEIESEEERDLLMPPSLKCEFDEAITDNFECTDSSGYVEPTCDLKEDENIFNEKDKLLDVLLKDDDNENDIDEDEDEYEDEKEFIKLSNDHRVSLDRSLDEIKSEDNDGILEETEFVMFKDQESGIVEEDVLSTRVVEVDIADCKILLEDITLRYPKLKEESSVKVTRTRVQKKDGIKNDHCKSKRKYCKEREESMRPKRVAKISQQELKERLKILKKEEKAWQCPCCIKMYHMRKPFEKHMRDDHSFSEEKIKEIFKDEDISNNLEAEVFKCNICDKIYLMEKRLLAHIKLHGPDGNLIFKCPCFCNLYFSSKIEATAHAHKEHRDLLYCEKCDKYMTGHDSLKNHMKNHHSEKSTRCLKRNLVCDKCGKKFSGRTSLSDHVRSDCGRMPLYPCTICGKHLTTAGILKTHLLLHKDETPYQCDKCGKTFKVKAQYKSHIKTRHTENKPFKCHLCPKEYPYRESLLTHMTVHTGIKRFLCNGCGKRFTCISNLQAHRKVQADTCGQLPLNAKATQYMGVQKGNLLLGAKPEAGLEYQETNTLIAKEVLDKDLPMAQELNFPSEPSAPLATVPLNFSAQNLTPYTNIRTARSPTVFD